MRTRLLEDVRTTRGTIPAGTEVESCIKDSMDSFLKKEPDRIVQSCLRDGVTHGDGRALIRHEGRFVIVLDENCVEFHRDRNERKGQRNELGPH